MNNILRTLGLPILTSLFAATGNGQTLAPKPTDSLYYVHLTNGNTLHSGKVQLVNSITHGKYLLLSDGQHIALSDAKDFKGWDGTFAISNINGLYDAYKLQNEGRRISLYTQCYYSTETVYAANTPGGTEFPTTISTREKVFYFRKDPDGPIQRLTLHNLGIATADNAASANELSIARTNIGVGIGLIAGGLAVATAGVISTVNHNRNAQNAYQQASATWFQEAQTNPNTPMPTAPHTGVSPLLFIGAAASVSAMIPLFNAHRHVQAALDMYNGID